MLVAGGYVVALAVAAVSALVSGDIGLLWRLTLFFELEEAAPGSLRRLLSGADEGPSATWPKVLVLLAAGGLWAWALWQSLRGPVAGRRPAADRGVRLLRVALYAQVACWLAYVIVPVWPWWMSVLDVLTLLAVAVAFYPVLRPAMGLAGLALFAGVSTNVLMIVDEVFGALDWHAAGRMVELLRPHRPHGADLAGRGARGPASGRSLATRDHRVRHRLSDRADRARHRRPPPAIRLRP